jgi:hypothetical protein
MLPHINFWKDGIYLLHNYASLSCSNHNWFLYSCYFGSHSHGIWRQSPHWLCHLLISPHGGGNVLWCIHVHIHVPIFW